MKFMLVQLHWSYYPPQQAISIIHHVDKLGKVDDCFYSAYDSSSWRDFYKNFI